MVSDIKQAFEESLKDVAWMDSDTKMAAKEKVCVRVCTFCFEYLPSLSTAKLSPHPFHYLCPPVWLSRFDTKMEMSACRGLLWRLCLTVALCGGSGFVGFMAYRTACPPRGDSVRHGVGGGGHGELFSC